MTVDEQRRVDASARDGRDDDPSDARWHLEDERAFLQRSLDDADRELEAGDLWPALADPGGVIAQRYGVTSPPTTFVINPAGRVTAVLEGPATEKNLDSFLRAARVQAARSTRG